MLGLGSGLTSVSAPSSYVLLDTYTADWSSDTDGWGNYSGNDVAVTLTHGVTFEGKSNALRVEFNADETGTAGFSRPSGNSLFSTTMQNGDHVQITCDIYLDSAYDSTGDGSDDITDRWSGTDTVYSAVQMPGVTTDFFHIAQNQWVSLDTPSEDNDGDLVTNASWDGITIYFTSSDDRPKDGARVYLHNFVAKLYRSKLFT